MTASDFFSNFTWTGIVAGLALALGIVNFYWMHLRVKKALYFLRIGRVGDMSPQFALINGGNRDLLLVEIFCQFNEKTPGQSFLPPQQVRIGDGGEMLLEAGKAVHCEVRFPEPFGGEFALTGEKDAQTGGFYIFPTEVQIRWADMDGKMFYRTVLHSKFGFGDDGVMRSCQPGTMGCDLYRHQK